MKRFSLWYKDCGESGLAFLYENAQNIDIIDRDVFWLADMKTGLRILSLNDELCFYADPEQELAIRIRFGEKISELV
jgi:hypothetical protein